LLDLAFSLLADLVGFAAIMIYVSGYVRDLGMLVMVAMLLVYGLKLYVIHRFNELEKRLGG